MIEDLRAQVERLEIEIEELSAAADKCQKLDFVARASVIAGSAWLVGQVLGLVPADSAATLAAISALLFGVVLYGSNRSTWREVRARLASLDARRTSLIDEIDPRTVRERHGSVRATRWHASQD